MTPVPRYRCRTCAATFTAWAPAERHADAERHCRIEVVIHPEQKEPEMSPNQKLRKDRRQGEKKMGPPPKPTAAAPAAPAAEAKAT